MGKIFWFIIPVKRAIRYGICFFSIFNLVHWTKRLNVNTDLNEKVRWLFGEWIPLSIFSRQIFNWPMTTTIPIFRAFVCLFVYSSTFANVSQMIDNIYYILAYRRSFYIHNNSIKIVNLKRAQIHRIRIFRWSILASHLKLPQLNRSR